MKSDCTCKYAIVNIDLICCFTVRVSGSVHYVHYACTVHTQQDYYFQTTFAAAGCLVATRYHQCNHEATRSGSTAKVLSQRYCEGTL